MNGLQRLQARIAELEAARAELQAALDGLQSTPPQPVSTVDWESRLSAARAVDALCGTTTASALAAQRQAERLALEKQARQAAQEALKATQTREALDTLDRDLQAATALFSRSVADAARDRLPDCERRYQAACAERMESAQIWAGWLSLCGRDTEAHQLLRAVGTAGDTMSLIARRTNQLRQHLLDEEETENA